jgi:hypothetical protein
MKTNLKPQSAPEGNAFISDLSALRARAREQMMKGAVTPSYPEADRKAIVELLNTALATELVCVLRYKRHYYVAHGIRAKFVSAEFLEHAKEEQAHADQMPSARATRRRSISIRRRCVTIPFGIR